MLTHCDATQALGNIEVYPHDHPDVDIMTFGGHKIHAPKGQSFMYVKKEVQDNFIINNSNSLLNLVYGKLDVLVVSYNLLKSSSNLTNSVLNSSNEFN